MSLGYEDEVQRYAARIFESMGRRRPSIFAKDFWQGQVMEWCMRNEAFKTEMFRFVDVFPALNDPSHIARHLQEYFCRPGQDFPKTFQWGLNAVSPTSKVAKIAAGQIEKNIRSMAYRFIAGADAADALPKLTEMREQGIGFTVDLLGEACVSEQEAEAYTQQYVDLVKSLTETTAAWKVDATMEGGDFPRVNVSVKPSALYSQFDPLDFQGALEVFGERLSRILHAAKAHGALVNLDAESYHTKALTLELFKRIMEQPEFADGPQVGIVIQAYLKDSENDTKELLKWAKKAKRRVAVRLVKGAYWDYEVLLSQQRAWPIPVYTDKRLSDENFENLTAMLLENTKLVIPNIATHNVRSLAHTMAVAQKRKLTRDDFEFQMLFGMGEPLKHAVLKLGYRLRDYVPIGDLVPGMGYLVRRLLENTSNESWLRQGFADDQSVAELLADPRVRTTPPRTKLSDPLKGAPTVPGVKPFFNEPLADFAHERIRSLFADGLQTAKKHWLGKHRKLMIGGEAIDTAEHLQSTNPANPSEIIGTTASATAEHVELAIAAAKAAYPAWRDTPPLRRAQVLFDAAAELRKNRWELSALQCYEVGKQWSEADGDVCEAIDFLEYYGREMIRLATPQRLGQLPGELSHLSYEGRGVAAVIAPWNFPLAIMTGMASAALVTGNCVIMKPAGQSPLIAAGFYDAFEKAGLPKGVLSFLPGRGSVVGAALTNHIDISLIALTGSMEVGLDIYKNAAITRDGQLYVKRVICELGGKNAIIVDSDADLDEAVQGVVKSAFAYQGQKCSACSRAIVLEEQYDTFVARLTEAVRSLAVGPAHLPHNKVGPVIDAAAQRNILALIEQGKAEGARVAVQGAIPNDGGCYVPPTVFVDVDPNSTIAQTEIFGPVVAVIKARDFDHALEIANGTQYALTGGIFTRSPAHIERARNEFRVGNLYINRNITGALVWRNPFGGSKRSGVGSKAGGPDYLQQFMDPRAICENTMRRGFAPTEDE